MKTDIRGGLAKVSGTNLDFNDSTGVVLIK